MILCSGCFDGLHSGHVRYLRAARRFLRPGDALVVAVAPDSYIRSMKAREPRWHQEDRRLTVEALDCVNYAIGQESDSVAEVIRAYRPRLFVKGTDWRNALPEDVLQACYESGTEIKFVDTPGRHVSEAHGRCCE